MIQTTISRTRVKEGLRLKPAAKNESLATLIVDDKLICLPSANLDELFEDLIGRELDEHEFLKGRSYLYEDLSPQLNNLYCQSISPVEVPNPSSPLRHDMA